MKITEVRVKLMEDPDDRLRAFCSITFEDAFVVRDLKIIEGPTGLFVAMPSRKLTTHCNRCGCKNHLRVSYCSQCGSRISESNAPKNRDSRTKLYADIAHPINSECRELIQFHVIRAYEEERRLSTLPGYVPRYDDLADFEPGSAAKPMSKATEPPLSLGQPKSPESAKPGMTPASRNSAPLRRRSDVPDLSTTDAAHHPNREHVNATNND